jgi:hypothetical protein
MKSINTIAPKGVFSLRAFNKKGECVLVYEDLNLVVDTGKSSVARLLAQANTLPQKRLSKIGFGEGTNAPDPNDTGLTNQFTKALDGFSYPDPQSVTFNWSLDFTEANGLKITEFGLFTDDDFLFSRKTRDVITKLADIRLEGTWTIIF